jgi:hypothetical protein
MRIALIVLAIVVVLALGAWGVTQVLANILPNGPVATLLGKHKPIKNIIQHNGLPKRPSGSGKGCATPGKGTATTGPPILGCGSKSGPPSGGPPFGGRPSQRKGGPGPPIP